MKTQTQAPQRADDGSRLTLWLSKLPKHSIPLNAAIARKAQREVSSPSSTSERLSSIIQQDPVLCLTLFLQAHRQLTQKEGDIQGMVHLIGLLGLDHIEQTLSTAKTATTTSDGLKEILSASLFSAHLANQLMPEKHGTRGTRFFLPTLFFNAPLWLMWTAAPKLMHHGQLQASKQHQPLEPLCRKSLGFSLHDLLDQTHAFLPLPTNTLKALAMDFHSDMRFWAKIKRLPQASLRRWFQRDKKAKQRFNSVETGIYLINQYVLALYLDWQGKHIKRWSTLLVKYFNTTSEQLDQTTTEVATHLPLPDYLSGPFSPLYRYRGLHREVAGNQPLSNGDIIKRYLEQLRVTYSLKNCLQLTLEALTEGTQVEHCMIITVTPENQLHIPLCYGFEHRDLSSLQIDMEDCGQLIRSLLQKPIALCIDSGKLERIEQQLPKRLTHYWQPRPCGIMSLFHHAKPYAIIVGDHRDWNAQRHQAFKTIGKQLSQTLKQCKISPD